MLHVVTFATDLKRIKYLEETAALHNLNFHCIMKSEWNGFIDKFMYVRNHLNNIDDNDIVCVIDSYDMLAMASSDEIVEKFKSYDCDLLIGAELNTYPDRYRDSYPVPTKYTTNSIYVNAGGYIGYKHAISKLKYWKDDSTIHSICADGTDQAYFTEYYLLNPSDRIKLDNYQKIFQNMHWVSWNEFYIQHGRFVNTILNEKPCFVHYNGGTWQTNDSQNILPIATQKLKDSMNDTNIFTFHEYKQIITDTCWPHKQID
jgi:hypothetical protein